MTVRPPNLSDQYWYPLWEKLVKMDAPAHIHCAGCYNGREVYDEHFSSEETLAVVSIDRSRVFEDCPSLKLMSHGGGSIPFQIGPWPSHHNLDGRQMGTKWKSFDEFFRSFHFDTCVYTKEPLELLFKIAEPERCLLGTKKPGSGSGIDPETGRSHDEVKPTIEGIGFLTTGKTNSIFEGNARRVFDRIDGGKTADR